MVFHKNIENYRQQQSCISLFCNLMVYGTRLIQYFIGFMSLVSRLVKEVYRIDFYESV